jgi:hypothetical protein
MAKLMATIKSLHNCGQRGGTPSSKAYKSWVEKCKAAAKKFIQTTRTINAGNLMQMQQNVQQIGSRRKWLYVARGQQ